jgi:hypothetical protein
MTGKCNFFVEVYMDIVGSPLGFRHVCSSGTMESGR